MRFKNNDLSYTEMKVTKYTPEFKINFKLLETSGSNWISVGDRGPQTDRYVSTMTFRGRTDTIRSLVNELTLLRTNKKEIEIDEFQENMFGDNIDHSGVIKCVVGDFDKEISPVMNVQQIKVTFIATDLIKIGSAILPSLNCLSHKWSGYSEWNTIVNETYNRDNYFVDRGVQSDTYKFEGTYSLTIEENRDLISFWEQQRGDKFTITDGDFGTTRMFGGYLNEPTYDVIITNISYTRVSPTRRNTKISLVRANG